MEKILPGVFIGQLVCANNKFEGREAKGLSKGRYDETFAGEDDQFIDYCVTEFETVFSRTYLR